MDREAIEEPLGSNLYIRGELFGIGVIASLLKLAYHRSNKPRSSIDDVLDRLPNSLLGRRAVCGRIGSRSSHCGRSCATIIEHDHEH